MEYSNNNKIHNNNNINNTKKRCECPLCIGFFYIFDKLIKNNKKKKYILF